MIPRSALHSNKGTFNICEIVNGFFETQLLNKETFLLLGSFFEKVLKVAVPNLGDFSKHSLTDALHVGINEDFPHEKIVVGDIRMLWAPFSAFEISLINFNDTDCFNLSLIHI